MTGKDHVRAALKASLERARPSGQVLLEALGVVNPTRSSTCGEACLQRAYNLTRQAKQAGSHDLHSTRDQLLAFFRQQGDDTRVQALVDEELQRLGEIYPPLHPSLLGTLWRAADVYAELGQVNKARKASKEASEILGDAPVL